MNLERLPQLAADKANHHLYGQAAALVGALTAMATGHDPRSGAVLFAVCIGVAKEVWDKVSGLGDPDVMDAVATASGSLPIVIGYCLSAGWA